MLLKHKIVLNSADPERNSRVSSSSYLLYASTYSAAVSTRRRLLDCLGDASSTTDASPNDVEAQVKRLVESYQSLKVEHDGVVARYTADYRKWRRFKQWLLVGVVDKEPSSRLPLAGTVGKENVPDDHAEGDTGESLNSFRVRKSKLRVLDVAARSEAQAIPTSVKEPEPSSKALGKRRAR